VDIKVKIYLPKRYADIIDDEDINSGKRNPN